MPASGFSTPTLAELIEQITSDLETEASWTYPRVKGSVGWAMARVQAGVAWGLYRFGGWISKQVLADTAESDYLARIASLYGITRIPPVASAGDLTFTGTPTTNIPSGTVLVRADGTEYTTDALGTIGGGGDVDIAVTCSTAGEDGDLTAGGTLTLSTPISGVDSEATVAAGGLTGGSDLESDTALRTRLARRLADPPQGGSEADYDLWVRAAVADVDQVWVNNGTYGPGTVQVLFSMLGDDPIPGGSDVTAAQAYIDGPPALNPVTAVVTVEAPTANTIAPNITLAIQSGYALADVKASIEAELRALFRTFEPGDTVRLSQISGAISAAPGEDYHTLVSPVAAVTLAANEVPKLGTVTWS